MAPMSSKLLEANLYIYTIRLDTVVVSSKMYAYM